MFRKLIAPAVLVASSLLCATALPISSASAEGQMKSYTVTFAYNRMDPAETIYANLERTAMKACRDITASSIHAAVATRKCAKQVITSALDAMNRTDVAAIHSDRHA